MVHSVDVTEERLQEEREALAGVAGLLPAPQGQQGGDAPIDQSGQLVTSDGLESWRAAVQAGFGAVMHFGAPEWDTSERGRTLLCDGLAEQLAEWFPDGPLGIDFNHCPPWLKLMGGVGFMAWANFDMKTMRFKPLRPEPEPGPEEEPQGETMQAERKRPFDPFEVPEGARSQPFTTEG